MNNTENTALKIVRLSRKLGMLNPKIIEDLNFYKDLVSQRDYYLFLQSEHFNNSNKKFNQLKVKLFLETLSEKLDEDIDIKFSKYLNVKYNNDGEQIFKYIILNGIDFIDMAAVILGIDSSENNELYTGCGNCKNKNCYISKDKRLVYDRLGIVVGNHCVYWTGSIEEEIPVKQKQLVLV
jgi:uncharacterized protein YfkK (UPF0435 family)